MTERVLLTAPEYTFGCSASDELHVTLAWAWVEWVRTGEPADIRTVDNKELFRMAKSAMEQYETKNEPPKPTLGVVR